MVRCVVSLILAIYRDLLDLYQRIGQNFSDSYLFLIPSSIHIPSFIVISSSLPTLKSVSNS